MSKNDGNMAEADQLNLTVDSFSTNGLGEQIEVKVIKSEDISHDSERRAELYEKLKDHPLAGFIGLFDECDAEDVSTNVRKYIGEYHLERHAKLSYNVGSIQGANLMD